MIARRPVVPAAQRGRPARRRRRRGVLWPMAAVVGVLAVAALAALGALALRDDGSDDPQAAPNRPIQLTGIGAYDPHPGDGAEHDDEAGLATDGDPSTFWRTENYNSALSSLKEGVGLVLEAPREVEPRIFTVTTNTPGITAEIQAGDRPDRGFRRVSGSQTLSSRATFRLDGSSARYFVLWITEIPPDTRAEITEVRAR